MKSKQVKKIIDMTEEMTALLEEIKKLPDDPDTFESIVAVQFAWTIRDDILALQREMDKLYRGIVKL